MWLTLGLSARCSKLGTLHLAILLLRIVFILFRDVQAQGDPIQNQLLAVLLYLSQPIQNRPDWSYYNNSMKRKSESISPNVVRSLKKHKSTGTKPKKRQLPHGNTHRWSEAIVSGLLQKLGQHVDSQIEAIARKQLIGSIVGTCEAMATNLLGMICPEVEEPQTGLIQLDKEPERVAFDPICGFDKLVVCRNQTGKNRESSHLIDSKVKPFGVYHNGKKQQQKIVSVSKLVPLESLSLDKPDNAADRETDKQESFLRQRIYDSLALPMLNQSEYRKAENSKNAKLGTQAAKQSSIDQCVFDYNGQKSSLATVAKMNSTAKPSTNNLLRTTYKVLETSILQDKRKANLEKVRHSRISNFDLRRLSNIREIIRNPNLKNELNDSQISMFKSGLASNNGQLMKDILEASFRQKQIKFKSIQRINRASKII